MIDVAANGIREGINRGIPVYNFGGARDEEVVSELSGELRV